MLDHATYHAQIVLKKNIHISKELLMLCENRQESGLPVDGKISISKNTACSSLTSGSGRAPKRSRLFIWSLCVLVLSPFSHLRAPFFTVHANLCTAIQIYFHDCQVKFKFMSALLFMNVSRAWKHFAYVISGNFVVCIIHSAIASNVKKFLMLVICKKWNIRDKI